MQTKSFDVAESTGTVLRVGTFTDASGRTHNITPEVIAMVYKNLDDSIPMYYLHQGSRVRKGFASKFELGDDVLDYKSHTYDADTQFKMATGSNSVSGEIEFDYQGDSIVDAHLTGIAVVPRGLINDTQMQTIAVAFGDDEMAETPAVAPQGDPTSTNSLPQNITINVPPVSVAAAPVPSIDEATHNELLEKYNTAVAENEAFKLKLNEHSKLQVSTLINELKLGGIETAEAIVEGLPTEQQLDILGRMKTNMIITKPGVQVGGQAPPPASVNPDKKRAEALKRHGVSDEMREFVEGK